MDELNEFLERVSRQFGEQFGEIERKYGNIAEKLGERLNSQFGDFGERFGGPFADRTAVADGEAGSETVERELTFGEEPELRFRAGILNVQVLPVETGGRARLVLHGREARDAELLIGSDENAVTVDVRLMHGMRIFQNMSRLGLSIYIPESTRVRGRVDAGSISVEGLHGAELNLRAEAGKIKLSDVHGRARLRSSAGNIVVKESSGALEARTDAGTIKVQEFSGALEARAEAGSIVCKGLRLEPGAHSLRTQLGSVDVSLAGALPVHVEARTSLGSVVNDAPGPNDAPVTLSVRTELGSVRIRPLETATPTPLRQVSLVDERDAVAPDAAQAVDLDPIVPAPADRPEATQQDGSQSAPLSAEIPQANAGQTGAEAAATRNDAETVRILGMLERHEITAGEAAALLGALRR